MRPGSSGAERSWWPPGEGLERRRPKVMAFLPRSTYATGGTLLKDGWYAGIPLPRNNACMIAHTACIAYTRRP